MVHELGGPLNVFIAVVGISAGPGFVAGLQKLGISLFLWGIFATAVPLFIGMFIANYVFHFHPALLLGVCAGSAHHHGGTRHDLRSRQEPGSRGSATR